MSTLAGAIDVGSNAIRMIVGRLDAHSSIETIAKDRESLSLGEDVFRSGRVSPTTIARCAEVFSRFDQTLKQYGVTRLRAVGTSALREAVNQREFVDAIRSLSGIEIEVISGEEEAEIIASAVSQVADLPEGSGVLLDIGGGSVEGSIIKAGGVVYSRSVPGGVSREAVHEEDGSLFTRPDDGDLSYLPGGTRTVLREFAEGILAALVEHEMVPGTSVVGTGGMFQLLRELRGKLFGQRERAFVSTEEIHHLSMILRSISPRERERYFGLSPDRAVKVVRAAASIAMLVEILEVSQVMVPPIGLKEGVLMRLCAGPFERRGASLSRTESQDVARSGSERRSTEGEQSGDEG